MFELTLPIADAEVFWPILIALGVVLGAVSSALGIGAGVISVPVLFGFFGIHFEVAVGSSLALLVGNCAMGVTAHARKGHVRFGLGLLLGVGVSSGALLGGSLLEQLSNAAQISIRGQLHDASEVVGGMLFACLLLWLGIMTLRKVSATTRKIREGGEDEQETLQQGLPAWLARINLPPTLKIDERSDSRISVWALISVGSVAGIFAGMLGVGGGFLMVPVMLYWLRMRTIEAVGTSLAAILVGAVIGTLQKAYFGVVDWWLVGILLAGGAAGIPLGVKLSELVPAYELRRGYGIFCLVGCAISIGKLLA